MGTKFPRRSNIYESRLFFFAAKKLSAEESYAQHLAHLREFADGHLSAQIAAEEKLSASQESLAARLEAERIVEKAKEKAEHEA